MTRRLLPLLVIAVALTVLAAACGDSGGDSGATLGRPDLPAVTSVPSAGPAQAETTAPAGAAATVTSDLPDVKVVNLAGGEVELASFAPSDRPILLWFWAPH